MENPDETHRHAAGVTSAASQHQDGAVDIGSNFKGGAANKVTCRLLSEHLTEKASSETQHGTNPLARESASRGVERVGRIAVAN
jgi:hypothetical protein